MWDDIGSKIEVLDANGILIRYRLLGIVADKIRDDEKVTKIWNSDEDKSGKATPVDKNIDNLSRDSNVPKYILAIVK